ncbi:hypothetical protein TRIUR3_05305 [Triticum urartu]|uniref:Uncharacterized protein n=1 Tax=Triticum urartu TaxID=4572 RepID=M7Z7P2_TRIUA|nr:hypothetical protein TRIUR3_05305 [Triticum urartu]
MEFLMQPIGRLGIGAATRSRTPCPNRVNVFEKAVRSYADNLAENVITPVLGTTFDSLARVGSAFSVSEGGRGGKEAKQEAEMEFLMQPIRRSTLIAEVGENLGPLGMPENGTARTVVEVTVEGSVVRMALGRDRSPQVSELSTGKMNPHAPGWNKRFGLIEEFPDYARCSYELQIVIMLTEYGRLCLAEVEGLNLHLWSLMASIDGLVTWTHERVIDLEKFVAPEVVATCTYGVEAIDFAEDAWVIFIYVHPSVYMIHLNVFKFCFSIP